MKSNNLFEDRINKSYDYDLKTNFVAAAIKYNAEKMPTHAGIAICHDEDLYIFHYAGAKISLEPLNPEKWFIENKFDFFEESEVSSFLLHCQDILEEADPTYGYFYSGSYFDSDGKYYSENKDFQFMSCVGFCLNVITGAIESKSYINHLDWEMSDSDKDAYFQEHMDSLLDASGKEDRNYFKNNQRRIYPIEYFVSSFIDIIPINKKHVDEIRPNVEEAIISKFFPI